MAAAVDFQNQPQTDGMQDQSGNQHPNESQNQEHSQHQHSSSQSSQQQATAGIPGKDDERKLFIGGLSRNTTDKELRDHFGKFGEIESISVKVDPHTGISRGFAFMVFTNPKTIDKLLASGEHYINKRKVDPKRVSKKPQHGKIFVGGLTPEISDDDIKNYFSQYGTIVELQAPFDKVKNQRKGFCFITFDSKEVVYKLLKTPKQTINGKEVDVKKVKVNPDPRNQGFWAPGYGYGYGGGYGYIPEYNGYHNYDDVYANYDYAGYDGYDNMGYGPKPRGNGPGPRQFQRHQPY
ncbi:PREDICTED: RNA-binding protein squid-like [Atta cephalotes]|uniref:RRM domain-containing protein n=2 Tax=Atta TaxID=12956 RepID=A0A158NBV2_ATTCE|nr:PREDICTED: RNA-binding protein squid-like [Atta cephalotes]XP_018047875.1 PREDICTED: RNA-binding protein squid-like isoform X1 [Atta colombica]KYM83153.1 RNA-binding protein squid [Atta colombica]